MSRPKQTLREPAAPPASVIVTVALLSLSVSCSALAQKPSSRTPSETRGVILVTGERTLDVPADVVLQAGHTGRVTAMAFGANAGMFVSAAEDGHVIVWDPYERTEEFRFSGHSGSVRSIALSVDNQLLASGADDGTVRIWDIQRRILLHVLVGSGASVPQVAISPDSRYLLSAEADRSEGSASAVRLWDLLSGRRIATLVPRDDGITTVFFTAQGHAAVASVMGDLEIRGTLNTFEVPSGRSIATTSELVRAVSSDGRRIAIQKGEGEHNLIAVVDTGDGNENSRIPAVSGPVSLSPNGNWIAYIPYPYESLLVRRVASAVPAMTIPLHYWGLDQVALSLDGSLVAASGRGLGGEIRLWRTADPSAFQSLRGRPAARSLVWTADSRTIITAGAELLYWDLETRKPIRGPALPMGSLGLALSPDGNRLATGGSRELRIWDRRSNELIRAIAPPCDVLFRPVFSQDGTLVAGSCRGFVSFWDVATGREHLHFGAQDRWATGALSFSPDGQFLVASAGLGRAILFRMDASGTAINLDLSGHLEAIAFSADSRWVALGTGSRLLVTTDGGTGPRIVPDAGQRAVIAVYNSATGRRVFSRQAGDWVSALALAEGGQTLLAATGEWQKAGKVLALESSSGNVLRALVDPVDAQWGAAFSPDHAWLAAVPRSSNEPVKLWKLKPTAPPNSP